MKISQMHSRQFTDNSGFEVFANPARGTTSMNFSARQVKKRWSRDGKHTLLLVRINSRNKKDALNGNLLLKILAATLLSPM